MYELIDLDRGKLKDTECTKGALIERERERERVSYLIN
jgi:ethanolamine utilization protein EutA (predicted chaperonin)